MTAVSCLRWMFIVQKYSNEPGWGRWWRGGRLGKEFVDLSVLVGLRWKDFPIDQDWTMPIEIRQAQVTGTNHPGTSHRQSWDIQTAVCSFCSLLRTNPHWKTCTAPRCLSWWGKRDVFWLFSGLWESWGCCETDFKSPIRKVCGLSFHVKVTFSRPCPRHSTTMCGKSALKRSFTQTMPNTLAWLKMCKCSTRHRGLVDLEHDGTTYNNLTFDVYSRVIT